MKQVNWKNISAVIYHKELNYDSSAESVGRKISNVAE